MTHIDPFAPADSDQHPANFHPGRRGEEQAHPGGESEAMPLWIALADEPVRQDDPDAAIIGEQRWEEYENLLAVHGTQEERDTYELPTVDWPDGAMPTLTELRERATAPPSAPEASKKTVKAAPSDDDLKAKLAALDAEGL